MKRRLESVRDVPKASILEAYREDGIRAQCVEITVKGGKLQKYTLSYGAFLDQHGITLEPGHAVKLENYSRVIGLPVSRGVEDGRLKGDRLKAEGEKAPNHGSKDIPHLPVLGQRGQGDRLKTEGYSREEERRPRGGSVRGRGKAAFVIREKIRAMAATSTTLEIARALDRNPTVIRYHLRQLGIKSKFCPRGRKQGTPNRLKAVG